MAGGSRCRRRWRCVGRAFSSRGSRRLRCAYTRAPTRAPDGSPRAPPGRSRWHSTAMLQGRASLRASARPTGAGLVSEAGSAAADRRRALGVSVDGQDGAPCVVSGDGAALVKWSVPEAADPTLSHFTVAVYDEAHHTEVEIASPVPVDAARTSAFIDVLLRRAPSSASSSAPSAWPGCAPSEQCCALSTARRRSRGVVAAPSGASAAAALGRRVAVLRRVHRPSLIDDRVRGARPQLQHVVRRHGGRRAWWSPTPAWRRR